MVRYEIRFRSGRTEKCEDRNRKNFQDVVGDVLKAQFYIGADFAVNTSEIEWVREFTE